MRSVQFVRLAIPGMLALAVLALGACSSRGEAPRLACPTPAIIDSLASFERFRDPRNQRPEELTYRAAMQNIDGTCTTAGQDLNIALRVEILVEPGPAFSGGAVEVPYFVAVINPSGEVLDRRDYVARLDVAPGLRRAGTTESFSQRFLGIGRQGGAGYRVLFGFALPREEALRRRSGG